MTVDPLRFDDLSAWKIAPRAAWNAGEGGLIRCFDTAEAATAFIAGPAGNAERQRRLRQRRRENAVALRLTVPDAVIFSLIASGRLTSQASLDKDQVSDAAVAVLCEWSKPWA